MAVDPPAAACVVQYQEGRDIAISGWLGSGTDAPVRDALQHVIAAGEGDLIVRLGDADVGDATGLGVLLGAHVQARRAGRRMILADLPVRTGRVLMRTGLVRVLGAGTPTPAPLT